MAKIATGSTFRRTIIGLAAASTLALSACGSEQADTAEAAPEDVIEGITIENARMVLAPVEGNPAAIYFDFSYEGERAFSLDRFSVEGAENAMMHQYGEYDFQVQMMEALPIPVTNGTEIEFKPGDLHVMAEGVSADLQPGGTTDITLKVSGGRTHKFTAEIRAAGDER
ncbi:copper chaperone PCu(A)C [uncultured Erythrobacter sp.]|uniref:copper chaperone PCu(A)C n=1 Tax=uncultured Erythrobacter sp. TaxID=263913 RepID=UPI0026213721|nr:copper chaperone PCu(A)C [uncultured Erythrobacter sp.]